MQLTPGRVALSLAVAAVIGVGAFALGHGTASGSESPPMQAADGPHQVTVPDLTAVAPLPSLVRPPKPKHQAEETATEEPSEGETSEGETPSEYETYEAPVEESTSGPAESSSSGNEATASPVEEAPTPEPTETAPSGGGEELVPEG